MDNKGPPTFHRYDPAGPSGCAKVHSGSLASVIGARHPLVARLIETIYKGAP
jgi:hypothetical protein